ncbi:hypothetical protein SK128_020918 [Halocaridina rubra]|uniref:Uncharacterized protein n=1 Tax=Halocaridina rubra TaxID=373956 RepID=A0AAN9AB18_HALRR
MEARMERNASFTTPTSYAASAPALLQEARRCFSESSRQNISINVACSKCRNRRGASPSPSPTPTPPSSPPSHFKFDISFR